MVRKKLDGIFYIVSLLLVGCLFTSSALAKKSDKEDYARADIIWSFPTHKISAEHDKKPRSDIAGTFGVGHYFSDNFRGDITATFRRYRYKSQRERQGIKSTAIMASGYFSLANYKRATLYFMAGAGVSFNKTGNDRYIDNVINSPMVVWGDTTQNLAWQAGIGTICKVRDNIYADLMYKYITLGATQTKNVSCGHTPANPATNCRGVGEQRSMLKNHELSIGIIFKF